MLKVLLNYKRIYKFKNIDINYNGIKYGRVYAYSVSKLKIILSEFVYGVCLYVV